MDFLLRAALRDPASSASLLCNLMTRAGWDDHQIEDELLQRGAIPEGPGIFHQLKVVLGLLELNEARRLVADRLLGDYNFDNEVVAVNGWCYYEDLLSCTVFVLPDAEDDAEAEDEEDEDEDQEAPDSVAVDFSVEFLPDSAIPFNWHGGSA